MTNGKNIKFIYVQIDLKKTTKNNGSKENKIKIIESVKKISP